MIDLCRITYSLTNIIDTSSSWSEVKRKFREKYEDHQLKNKLLLKLEKCVQGMHERVYEYTERYQSLVVRTSSGQSIDSAMNIMNCERGFIPLIRQELAKYRSTKSQESKV